MSESPWAVAYHADHADEEDKPEPTKAKEKEKDRAGKQAEAPVGLVLTLPQQVVDALAAVAERLTRVAIALEENTKATQKLIGAPGTEDLIPATQSGKDTTD